MDDLHCPFESALNPGTEEAHHHTREWAEHFGLVRDANAQRQVATERFTWLVGHFFPWAQKRELELISDFTSWLFWHDDLCDETTLGEDPPALAQQFDWLLGILTRRHPARANAAFDLAMADLRDRFEQAAPSWGWFARMVASIHQYFDAGVWEAANRRQGIVPGVGTFIGMRRFAGGMYIYTDFVELAGRFELPLVVRGHRDVSRLVQITCNVACWHNDLFSLDKELAWGDVHNLVVVLARERQLSLPRARALAVEYCNREVASFIPTARRLAPHGAEIDGMLAGYQRGLGALMRGNLDWSLGTDRYRRSLAPQEKAVGTAGA
jgi:Terpene synthase family 2, C-terminal metal binding